MKAVCAKIALAGKAGVFGLLFAVQLPEASGAGPKPFKNPSAAGAEVWTALGALSPGREAFSLRKREAEEAAGFIEEQTDPYLTLGVSRGASLYEVREAYLRLRAHWHPDRSPSLEAEAMFSRIQKAYESVKAEREGGGGDILHQAIQSALASIANGRRLSTTDRELKKTLELLLQDPKIRQSINSARSASSNAGPPVYSKRGTPLQMALYLPETAALLLKNGADAEASGPDLAPPVEQALLRRSDFFPFQTLAQAKNFSTSNNLAAFNMLRRHGKIDLSGTTSTGETVLVALLDIINSLKAQSWRYRQRSGRAICPPNSLCETQKRPVYCSFCESAQEARQWTKLFFQLIGEGADLNAPNAKGQTVLAFAIMSRNKKISRGLLISQWGKSIDWEYRDNAGRTYLQQAIDAGDEETALNIVNTAGADMSYRNRHEQSYLESALSSDFQTLSVFLARNGAFEALKPNERERVMALAARRRNYSLLRMIQPLMGADERPAVRKLAGRLFFPSFSRPKEPLRITGPGGARAVASKQAAAEAEDENGGGGRRRISKLKSGPTLGEYGMMAGAVGGGLFAAAQGAGPLDTLHSAAAGAIALGLPFVFAGSCRYAFKHFREKQDSARKLQANKKGAKP